jgi:hypothetical protein
VLLPLGEADVPFQPVTAVPHPTIKKVIFSKINNSYQAAKKGKNSMRARGMYKEPIRDVLSFL